MGLGLAVGVATEIFIRKDSYSKEEIINKINNYLNLDLYDIEEDDQYISLIIKSDKSYRLNFLEGNIIETISYISNSELKIFSNLIVYNFSYKVYMEEYCEFFRYVRAKMQQSINNVLKDDVFLMLATG